MRTATKVPSVEPYGDADEQSENDFVSVAIDKIDDTESGIRDEDAKPEKQEQPPDDYSSRWTRWIQRINKPVMRGMLAVTHHASIYPKSYVVVIIFVSIALLLLGLATNFTQETADDVWSPVGSKPVVHGKYIDDESGFPEQPRTFALIVHNDGENVLGGKEERELAQESVSRTFEALDTVRSVKGYDELCEHSSNPNPEIDAVTGNTTCTVLGITRFWNSNVMTFQEEVKTDLEAAVAMSSETYPDGIEVDYPEIIGYAGFDDDGILNFGQSFVTFVLLSSNEKMAEKVEEDALNEIEKLQHSWAAEDGNVFRLEFLANRSVVDEFTRAILTDLPLVPVVFVLMSILCVIIFSKKDRVKSQSLLGFGAIVTVLLAIMATFGLLFTCGVPFTNLTPILPFILFGVGLDDAFIITGSYGRTDSTKDVVDRIQDVTRDVGNTILLTTITAATAFGLGGLSSISAVWWLVAYALPTIIVDFIFQITFFVSLVVLDDRRQKANRLDCVICCKAKHPRDETDEPKRQTHFADDLMVKYADFLLKPRVKAIVVFLFTVLFALCAWSTSQLEQYFDFTEVIPKDSYIQTWFTSLDWYERSGARPDVYFRNVDFSNETIQLQMEKYVTDLADLDIFSGLPSRFWLRDLRKFVANQSLEDLSFNDQVDAFLRVPVFLDLYNTSIVRDEDGNITSSRTGMTLAGVDQQDVHSQIHALKSQREVTKAQPINEREKHWPFFTFADQYYIWEFYNVAKEELIVTTVFGVATVAVLGLIFIPHWSAIFWVGSMVSVLYVDLLGFVQICGIRVNPVTYVAMVMSIGLMIDYVFHVTLRFVEVRSHDRQVKAKYTLKTIGASVMVGGISTMLGVIPLAFSSSKILFTVFIIFFGLVVLGLAHGLILLPVLLSVFGPVDGLGSHEIPQESDHDTQQNSSDDEESC